MGRSLTPLISCLLVTRDRPAFVALAARWYSRQTWPRRELIVVDGSAHPAPVTCEHYLHAPGVGLGARRNLAVRHARGDILATWDDDDWFAPERLEIQVRPLLTAAFGLCALATHHVLDLDGRVALERIRRRPGPHSAGSPALGTLAWRRNAVGPAVFAEVARNEDVAFLAAARAAGARLRVLPGRDLWAQGQHRRSTSRLLFEAGRPPFGPGRCPRGLIQGDLEMLYRAAGEPSGAR